MPSGQDQLIQEATGVLVGSASRSSPERLLELGYALSWGGFYNYAWRLCAHALESPIDDERLSRTLRLKYALWQSKDRELPEPMRFDLALEVLESDERDPLKHTKDQEKLGIIGLIYKRKWEAEGLREFLQRSLHYFDRGWQIGVEHDMGYTAVNAAFNLDLLAALQDPVAGKEIARGFRDQARELRTLVVLSLEPLAEGAQADRYANDWWYLVTLGEASFGLERYDEAREWLRRARTINPDPEGTNLESVARNLSTLARLRGTEARSALVHVLRDFFLEERADGFLTAHSGKVGLSLSGEGFRASLYHLGVLARLAELDVLRHVEVISCSGGGAIVGAHYFLEVRRLLEQNEQADIGRDSYVEVVRKVAHDFIHGVQTLPSPISQSPRRLLRFIAPGFTRTEAFGEILEERLYSRVEDGEGSRPRMLKDQFVRPEGESPDFDPERDNWWRSAKVPILVLNAVSLNTGHTWQFADRFMGESPHSASYEKVRLKRIHLREAPEPQAGMRLGFAVAACAAIPGQFRPVALKGLYPGISVRLVGGASSDSLKTALEQDCTTLIVADGTRSVDFIRQPSWAPFGVAVGTISVLRARENAAAYRELAAWVHSSPLREAMVVRLNKGLIGGSVDWVGAQDPVPERPSVHDGLTPYNFPEAIQRGLAALRSDFETFSDSEAQLLMLSGYRMTEYYLDRSLRNLPTDRSAGEDWDFLKVAEDIQPAKPRYNEILDELELGRERRFRPLRGWLRGLLSR